MLPGLGEHEQRKAAEQGCGEGFVEGGEREAGPAGELAAEAGGGTLDGRARVLAVQDGEAAFFKSFQGELAGEVVEVAGTAA